MECHADSVIYWQISFGSAFIPDFDAVAAVIQVLLEQKIYFVSFQPSLHVADHTSNHISTPHSSSFTALHLHSSLIIPISHVTC